MTVRAIAVILFCFIVANGQGTYTNPIIDADYSDPDVIRVGDDFYLTGAQNLWPVPNLLLQKLPARRFTVTTLIDASGLRVGERSGLLMMGRAIRMSRLRKRHMAYDSFAISASMRPKVFPRTNTHLSSWKNNPRFCG